MQDSRRDASPVAEQKEPMRESAAAGDAPASTGSRDSVRTIELETARRELDASSQRLSNFRLGGFLVLTAGLIWAVEWPFALVYVALPGVLVFAASFVRHGVVLRRLDRVETRLTLLTERVERQRTRRRERPAPRTGATASRLEGGECVYRKEPDDEPLDSGVVDDLQIFDGVRSLFGFLDWTSSTFGARRLARLLRRPLRAAADIRERQELVAELAAGSDAREKLLRALLPLRRYDLSPLGAQFAAPGRFAHRRGLHLFAHLSGTAAPALLIAFFVFGSYALLAPVLVLVALHLLVIGWNVKDSNEIRNRLLLFDPLLVAMANLENEVRAAKWESRIGRDIAAALASVAPTVKRLRRRLALLAFHSYGPIFEIINILTLWELRLLPPTERRFAEHSGELEAATGALGELDALLCLALPLAEQAEFVLPEAIDAGHPQIEGEAVGHPVLEPGDCVRNDVRLGTDETVWILTGSNMSGKSTYLRAIGLNVLLAGAGGPVSAQRMRWTPVAIHTDVNIRDSLDDGKSYFQVEVERIKQTIAFAADDPRVLILCDEMFRGTNSTERLAIARSVVRAFRRSGALAIVATHDLSLTELAAEAGEEAIANYHLRDRVDDGVMTFDYILREGPSPTTNAVRVLEQQGYPSDVVAEAREFLARDDRA